MLLVVVTSLSPDEITRMAASSIGKIPEGTPPPPRDERTGATRAIRSALASSDSLPRELGSIGVPDSTLLRVRKIGGRQASVMWTRSLGTIPASVEPVAEVWNAALSSRIQFQLREREGLAYSIGSTVDRLDDGTLLWSATAGTGAKNIPRIVAGLREAIDAAFSQPPDTTEVRKQGAQLYGSTLRRRASRMNRAYAAGLAILDGRDPAGIDEEMRAPTLVTREEVRAMLMTLRQGPGVMVIAY
jgi:predicted Zn-dependent peptidase